MGLFLFSLFARFCSVILKNKTLIWNSTELSGSGMGLWFFRSQFLFQYLSYYAYSFFFFFFQIPTFIVLVDSYLHYYFIGVITHLYFAVLNFPFSRLSCKAMVRIYLSTKCCFRNQQFKQEDLCISADEASTNNY